jgi:hypothetical protein
MNEIVLAKEDWFNEVETILNGYSFNKTENGNYNKKTIQYSGGQTIVINGQRMEQPGQQIKISNEIRFIGDGWIADEDESNKQNFTQVVFEIKSDVQELIYEECIYWNDAQRVRELINQIFKL